MNVFRLICLSVKGYRGFSEGATLDLAPLSLVYGENSAGKSSLLRLMVAIARAISGRSQEPLVPVSTTDNETSVRQLFGASTAVSISLEFLCSSGERRFLDYEIAYFPELNSAKIVELKVRLENEGVLSFILSASSRRKSEYSIISRGNGEFKNCPVGFWGLTPDAEAIDNYGALFEYFLPLSDELTRMAHSLIWFGPLRHTPERSITLTPFPAIFKQDGSDIVQALYPANRGGIAIAEWVSDWYRKTTNHILTVIPSIVNGQEVFSVNLAHVQASHLTAPISDHGAGMAQVLPIVISCAMAQINKTPMWLVLENPELHLHDKAHENLANLLIDTAVINPDVMIVAETHSENVLLALQLRTVSGDGVPNAIVNWIQKEDSGHSVCRSFSFDDNGSLGGLWSKSIFGYTSDLARRIIQARRAKEIN